MGEEGGEGKVKKRVVVESLGWLTESSIMPKKHRAIEGVGASSILELKAQLYHSQEESKRLSKESIHTNHLTVHRAKSKISAHDPFSSKNSGVDARSAKYVIRFPHSFLFVSYTVWLVSAKLMYN